MPFEYRPLSLSAGALIPGAALLLSIAVGACGGETISKATGEQAFVSDSGAIDSGDALCSSDQAYRPTVVGDFEAYGKTPHFTVNDPSGISSDTSPTELEENKGISRVRNARCGGTAAHIVDTGMTAVTGFGRQFYFSFSDDGDHNFVPFDATGFDGVSFWVKGVDTAKNPTAILFFLSDRFTVNTSASSPVTINFDDGPFVDTLCNSSSSLTIEKCDPFIQGVGLTDDWRFVTVPFAQLHQKGYGVAAPYLDKSTVLQLGFQVSAGDWDFWIDDVGFYHAPGH
jgi:hypothetical protein